MGKFDGIAILTDLDGTFLGENAAIVPRNIEAVEYFKREGGLFSLSTGRMHYSLDKTIPNVDTLVNAPAILCNGAYLYDFQRQKTLAERTMNGRFGLGVLGYIRKAYPDLFIRVSCRRGYFFDTEGRKPLSGFRLGTIEAVEDIPFEAWSDEGWYKFVAIGDRDRLHQLETDLEKRFEGRLEANRSGATALEYQDKGTNKSTMLSAFCDAMTKDGKKPIVYACGDYENDIALLRKADIAVCPANAIDRVKAICQMTLCSNREGLIAALVERLDGKAR